MTILLRLLLICLCLAIPLSAQAADTAISALTAAGTLDGTETFPCVQSGTTKKCTLYNVGPVVDARQHGVLCDGVSDDTDEIQAAITNNYGKTVVLPIGNCLISAALTITAPIDIRGSTGARYNSTNYGTRIYTDTLGINLINLTQALGGGNEEGGGSISNILLDGNSKAAINLNITGATTGGWAFNKLVFINATHLGTYVSSNHSFQFNGCHWALNGITSNLQTDGGIQLDGGNAVVITGSRSEGNFGSGVIVSAGYSNAWYGGTIEGNQHHGVYGLGTGAHFSLKDVDFESNNQSSTASRYDVLVAGSGYWSLTDLRFSGATTTNFIINNGANTLIRNCRGLTANKILWTLSANGGIFEGDVSVQLDAASDFRILGQIQNTRPLAWLYTTPAVPASTVATSPLPTNIRVHITGAGTTTAYTILDGGGTAQAFSVALVVGQVITLPAGYTLKITYSVVPTWKWEEY